MGTHHQAGYFNHREGRADLGLSQASDGPAREESPELGLGGRPSRSQSVGPATRRRAVLVAPNAGDRQVQVVKLAQPPEKASDLGAAVGTALAISRQGR